MTRRRRVGFTLAELMVSVTIIGLLSSIAIPKYRTIKRRAIATQIIGDFDVVRVAALSFFVDSGYFPDEANAGNVPANMGMYLPNTFEFKKPEWTLDYEQYVVKQSMKVSGQEIIGIAAQTADKALGETAMALLGNGASVMINGKLTFIISGM